MKRLQGWGDVNTTYPVTEPARAFLTEVVGAPLNLKDASPEDIIAKIPKSKLKPHPLITTDPLERLQHARGQSASDWVDMCDGLIDTFPDGVAYPSSIEDIKTLIEYAKRTGAHLIPYGGGSSVVGHLTPRKQDRPNLSIDMSRIDKVIELNQEDMTATIGAGAKGPILEEQLNQAGYTLGHFPQSWEYSTLGG